MWALPLTGKTWRQLQAPGLGLVQIQLLWLFGQWTSTESVSPSFSITLPFKWNQSFLKNRENILQECKTLPSFLPVRKKKTKNETMDKNCFYVWRSKFKIPALLFQVKGWILVEKKKMFIPALFSLVLSFSLFYGLVNRWGGNGSKIINLQIDIVCKTWLWVWCLIAKLCYQIFILQIPNCIRNTFY